MKEVYVDIREIASGLEKRDLLKIVAACYLEDEYGYDVCDMEDGLENLDEHTDLGGDFLTAIENTLANIDREYGEEEDYDYDDDYEEDEEFPSEEDDYEDEDYEEDYECDCGTCEECTQRKIEENRRRNEEYLGL